MLRLSPLAKTWIIDIDGTIVKHNGHLNGGDILLDGVREFCEKIGAEDKVVFLTARKNEEIELLKTFLEDSGVRYDYLLGDMPVGERILINDDKPSGLKMAYAICKKRDAEFSVDYKICEEL